MIRTLIVDDEPLARLRIRTLLQDERDVQIAGEAERGAEAVRLIEQLSPALVFLDVQMPGLTGFDVIEAVGAQAMPPTIFVTAHDAFAIRAFEVQALDYLLKPFDDRRFSMSVERARKRAVAPEDQSAKLQALVRRRGAPHLATRSYGRVRLIPLEEVDWIRSAGDYAEGSAGGRPFLLNESLASLTKRLPADMFARVHRSAIVRLDRIAELRPIGRGDGAIRLADGSEFRMSRRYRNAIRTFLCR